MRRLIALRLSEMDTVSARKYDRLHGKPCRNTNRRTVQRGCQSNRGLWGRSNLSPKFSMEKSLYPSILIFTKLPVPGRVKTRLGSVIGMAAAARLAAAMLMDRLRHLSEQFPDGEPERVIFGDQPSFGPFQPYLPRARRDGAEEGRMQFRHGFGSHGGWHYRNQGPGALGERLLRGIREFSTAGCVILGSDVVTYREQDLPQALSALRRGQAVIQPALDGGFTLLGLPAGPPPRGWTHLEEVLLGKSATGSIHWEAVASALSQSGWESEILAGQRDIDEWEDVESLLSTATESIQGACQPNQFLRELSILPKDVWSVSAEMSILRAGEAAPDVPAEKE
jgi:glycosyltransferase A (GT-A) superfamily protein (DUF2064 family)